MEQPNWWLIPAVAVIPLITGFIWYNPGLFGKAWMNSAEISEERATSGNKVVIYALTYLFSLFGAYILTLFSVHQSSIFQLFMGDASHAEFVSDFMAEHGSRHRSFGHGVIHGIELALLLGLTFIGIHSLLERRSFKYVMIHVGYWVVTFALMGGILCAYF